MTLGIFLYHQSKIRTPLERKFSLKLQASSVLQNAVAHIFGSMRDESICIFDNILSGGNKEQLRTQTKQLIDI